MNEKNTLEEKIKRLEAGLPTTDLYAIKTVESSAYLKLKDFFADFPEELETIKLLFQDNANIEELTYMEMAAMVNREIINGKKEEMKEILISLAIPIAQNSRKI